jgi:hypothetical protein
MESIQNFFVKEYGEFILLQVNNLWFKSEHNCLILKYYSGTETKPSH